ncbi:MAG: hypothetical protein KDK89_06765 [Alphaproteobacteria bacterium]|nr:hypothetical protein [Alphaproteobacteria bacterium]
MIELLERTQWDQARNFLASGDPPMIFRLLALNTVFLILYIVRRAKGARPMEQSVLLGVQGLLILSNMLVMFQNDITRFLDRLI